MEEKIMKKKLNHTTIRSFATLLWASAICLATFFSTSNEPFSPVPFSVQNFLCITGACLFGGMQGAGAVGLFIIAGGLGIPVFALCKGGIKILTGETGGYIWGYFIGAVISGLVAGTPFTFEKKFNVKNWLKIALAAFLGYIIIYVPGSLWLRTTILNNTENPLYKSLEPLSKIGRWKKIFEIGIAPFIYTDILKLIITIPLCAAFRPLIAKILYGTDEEEKEELIEALKKKKKFLDSMPEAFIKKKR